MVLGGFRSFRVLVTTEVNQGCNDIRVVIATK